MSLRYCMDLISACTSVRNFLPVMVVKLKGSVSVILLIGAQNPVLVAISFMV